MNHSFLPVKRLASSVTLAALVIALVMSFGWAGPTRSALAQGDSGVNCNGLNEDDCTLLKNAQSAMTGVTQMTLPAFNFSMTMTAEGETMEMGVGGAGALVMAPALVELAALMPQSNQMMADMSAILDLMDSLDEDLIQSILADSAGHVRIDELSITAPDQSVSMPMEMIFKDSTLYVRLTSPNGAEAWFGEQLSISDTELQELSDSLDELREQMAAEDFQSAMTEMSEFQSLMTDLSKVANKHVTTTRGEDATLHDQAMAPFTTTLDLPALLADPELATAAFNLLTSPMFADAMEGTDTSEINAAQVQLLLTVVSVMFKDPVIRTEQWIGLDDGAVHKTASTLAMTIDPSLLADSGDSSTAPIEIALEMLVEVDPGAEVDPSGFPIPLTYLPMDKASSFRVGSPDLIDEEIEPGQSVEATLSGDGVDIYALPISERTSGTISFETSGYGSLVLYGPDGFEIDRLQDWGDSTLDVTFGDEGVYLIVVEGEVDSGYTFTVSAE